MRFFSCNWPPLPIRLCCAWLLLASSLYGGLSDPKITMKSTLPAMAEQILDLTLEIIYLLIGEDYVIVKRSGDNPTSKLLTKTLTSVIPATFLVPGKVNQKKVLQAAKKMVELLTGEVPIRCQDVTVYFSMEEWEYLEGHKDLYKDVMMEDRPPLTSTDVSRKRNPPERCPRPLEDLTIPRHDQHEELRNIKVEVKEEEEETSVSGAEQSMEEGEMMMKSKQKESSLHGQQAKRTSEERAVVYPHCDQKDISGPKDSSGFFTCLPKPSNPEGPFPDQSHLFGPSICPRLESTYRLLHSSNAEKPSKGASGAVRHSKTHSAGKNDSCSECGKCFTETSSQRAEEKRYQCHECGKRFFFKSDLTVHQRVHTGEEPYPCFECGKSFSHRTTLVCHQRMHRGEKPFLCSDCGKCFTRKSCLLQHERIHTGVKPYTCSECGKSFNQKSSLISHQRGHRGEKPFTCSVCGKSFTRSSSLIVHHRFHTGERPYTCLKCGKCFSQKANFVKHQKIHTR